VKTANLKPEEDKTMTTNTNTTNEQDEREIADAEEGDAIQRIYRNEDALLRAAWAVHPDFVFDRLYPQRAAVAVVSWVGEGEQPSRNEVIEWYRQNYPEQTREIEQRIDQEVDATPIGQWLIKEARRRQ
jgi:hypothetical protein